jgi:hypothetical protein
VLRGRPARSRPPRPVAAIARACVVVVLVQGAHETSTGVADPGALGSGLLGNGSVGAVLGSAAWLLATVAAAVALKAHHAPTGAVVSLIGCGLLFAPTHVPPFGPAAMIQFAVAAVLLHAPRAPAGGRPAHRREPVRSVRPGNLLAARRPS